MNKTTKKIFRTEAEWQKILSEYQSSSEPVEVFCRRRGIGYSTFKKWQKRLHTLSEQPAFYELRQVGHPTTESAFPNEIDLGLGRCLRLRNEANPTLVAELIRLSAKA